MSLDLNDIQKSACSIISEYDVSTGKKLAEQFVKNCCKFCL